MLKRLIFFATNLLLLFSIIAGSFVVLQTRQMEQEQYKNLQSIAKLKEEQIRNWLEERQGDCKSLAVAKSLLIAVKHYVDKQSDAATAEYVLGRFRILQSAYQYANVMLLNSAGQVVLASGKDVAVPEVARNLVLQAIAKKQILNSDLYLDAFNTVRMDWVVPVLSNDAKDAPATAAIILRVDPRKFLYPTIESWPVTSATAESLLIRKQDDTVLFLNELRYRKNTALRLQLALLDQSLPAAVAVNADQPGVIKGLDYRGIEVIAAYRPIAGTDWHIVAKVDRAELLVSVWHALQWIIGISVIALLAILLIVWRLLKYADELKTKQLLSEFFDLPFIGMAITCPKTQKWLRINAHLCEMLGYTPAELQCVTWAEITHPEDLGRNEALFEKLKQGEINHYTLNKRYIRKDGKVIDTLVDVRCHRRPNGGVEYLIATIEDITERKRTEQLLAQSVDMFRAITENSPLAIAIYAGDDKKYQYVNPILRKTLRIYRGRSAKIGRLVAACLSGSRLSTTIEYGMESARGRVH